MQIIYLLILILTLSNNFTIANENHVILPKLPSMAGRLSSSGIHFFSSIGHKIVIF